ncbi:hypothetical protein [Sphingomonas fennica]|uniref:DUF2306 domain-containing protein n=1 Tax=Edaphosphingomonas fennica TaxID=114404 RepID=A0A2T4I4E2_9SPHN|nr:hypothetical protein [Sphingomonas fennica]PTD24264.1 hypothetical protein CV103_08565 [Sphingomonas fennica]
MATIALARRRRWAPEHIFYTGIAASMLVAVFIGFAPSWFLVPFNGRPAHVLSPTPLVHLHGAVFSAWMLLFVTQTALAGAGRTDIHRRLGMLGLPLVIAMIVIGTLTGLHGVARASGPPIVPPLSWAAIPLFAVPGFGGLILAALWKRRAPQTHKRLMVLAMVPMMGAAFGRMPWFAGLSGIVLVPALYIVLVALWDMATIRRIHRATLWGGLYALAAMVLPILVWQTEAWLGFARWAAALVA